MTFINKNIFPDIVLPDGRSASIRSNHKYFRINDSNCEGKPECRLDFWFQIGTNFHLYYASTKTDVNVLGAISIQKITKVDIAQKPAEDECGDAYCFTVQDTVDISWKLCSASYTEMISWVCSIKSVMGVEDPICSSSQLNSNVKVIIERIQQPIIMIPLPSRECNENWNYNKNGEDWECDCSEGFEQSPIDLPKPELAIDSPVKPMFNFFAVPLINQETTIDQELIKNEELSIKYHKNAIKILHSNMGKAVTIDGAVFFAEEVVFHTPSEHTIDGKRYDMEIQIIFYGQTKGDISKQVMLCFLVEQYPGNLNMFIDDIDIYDLPDNIYREKKLLKDLFIPKLLFDKETIDVYLKPFSFYTYQGSLTAPPCSERTIVYVVSDPIRISTTALRLFQEALRIPALQSETEIIVENRIPQSNRSTQNRNERPIFYYNHIKYCGPDPQVEKPKPEGHYEKVNRSITHYFYVNGEQPSGLPGSFVVTEKEADGNANKAQS